MDKWEKNVDYKNLKCFQSPIGSNIQTKTKKWYPLSKCKTSCLTSALILLTMFFFCAKLHSHWRDKYHKAVHVLLCQTEPINYTVCSELLYVFVGDIPLHIDIRETADSGKPIVVSQPDCLQVQCTTPDIVLKQHQANLTWTLKKETRLKKHKIRGT